MNHKVFKKEPDRSTQAHVSLIKYSPGAFSTYSSFSKNPFSDAYNSQILGKIPKIHLNQQAKQLIALPIKTLSQEATDPQSRQQSNQDYLDADQKTHKAIFHFK